MTTMDLESRFVELTGHSPFAWRTRLFEDHLRNGRFPYALDLPAGLGKTSVMAIWYLARRAGARVPRRLVYAVDRRAAVDRAKTAAGRIKERSRGGALRISRLRGQYADNREWLEDPAAPAIVVGTVDMIGSRPYQPGYLFITRDIGVAEYIAHHVAVMYRGEIVEQGPAEQVLKNPRNDYTRKLLSAVARVEKVDR